MESHTIANAMRRGELDEDEAYFVLRFAGRMGYTRTMRALTPWYTRLRKKLVWVGGWEVPELMQWDEDLPAWRLRLRSGRRAAPWPVTLFSVLTLFGGWWQLKCLGGYLVWAFNQGDGCYWSPDGTPHSPRTRRLFGKGR